jgi:hypothetical protein
LEAMLGLEDFSKVLTLLFFCLDKKYTPLGLISKRTLSESFKEYIGQDRDYCHCVGDIMRLLVEFLNRELM